MMKPMRLTTGRCARRATPSLSSARNKVGGFSIGDFRVSQYVSDRVGTGIEQATAAAVAELYGTGLSFTGVR